MKASDTGAGGMIGECYVAIAKNSYNNGDVKMLDSYKAAGGVVGKYFGGDFGESSFDKCYYLNSSGIKGKGEGDDLGEDGMIGKNSTDLKSIDSELGEPFVHDEDGYPKLEWE